MSRGTKDLVERLLATLPCGRPGLFNPWSGRCDLETAANGFAPRIRRLEQHLACDARFVLVGEAGGYQGARYSGVAFTSERLLLEGWVPRIPAPADRLSQRRLPFSEPSATIVWSNLRALGIEDYTVLWNAMPLHPYEFNEPWSNRSLAPGELETGLPALQILRDAFPGAFFIPAGKEAGKALVAGGIDAAPWIRHPSNGGATRFASSLAALVRSG